MILQVQDTLAPGVDVSIATGTSIWFWIAMFELLIILFMVWRRRKKVMLHNPIEELKVAKNKEVDMDDLMMSITNSREMYKKLSRKYHPDRFINTEKFEVAEELFKKIVANERNYAALKTIEQEAKEKLG